LAESQWIVDRGDGKPTANLVILSFLDPLALVNNRDPAGITARVVEFFTSKGITVMASIGGASWTSRWDQAIARDPVALAKNTAALAQRLHIGIEIDYEGDAAATITGIDQFVKAYRAIIPLDNSTSAKPESLLTVDMGDGLEYLAAVAKAASGWFSSGLINWATAMVNDSPWKSITEASSYWQQHLDGSRSAGIAPVAPHQLGVSLYAKPYCASYNGTVLQGAVNWVNQKHSLGIFFWGTGNGVSNSCKGVQDGSKVFLP